MSDPNQPAQPPEGQPPESQPPAYGAPTPPPAYGSPAPPPYGSPAPPPAYGAPDAYGAAPSPYGAAPSPYGAMMPSPPYADWGKRVLAYLIDSAIGLVVALPALIGIIMASASVAENTDASTGQIDPEGNFALGGVGLVLVVIGVLLSLAFGIWNLCIKQGRTGYSIGKGIIGIKLISEQTGQPVGAGMSFVRQLAHIVDGAVCDIGYLWPLWDAKRQTFADKIMNTIVIVQPKD